MTSPTSPTRDGVGLVTPPKKRGDTNVSSSSEEEDRRVYLGGEEVKQKTGQGFTADFNYGLS